MDYIFIQCSIDSEKLDFTGNCGNILSGVGPFALEEGLIPSRVLAPLTALARNNAGREEKIALTLRCLNNGQLIRSTFLVRNGKPVENGDMVIDGVAGMGSPIQLDFLDPAGSMCKSLCPTATLSTCCRWKERISESKSLASMPPIPLRSFVFLTSKILCTVTKQLMCFLATLHESSASDKQQLLRWVSHQTLQQLR